VLRDSLSYFIAVAQAGSIRAASSELGIAQSAVSRQLQSLEYEVGTLLFERSASGIVLTAAGDALYRHARSTQSKAERFKAKLAEMNGDQGGQVRISAIEAVVSDILPSAIARASLQRPLLRYSIKIVRTSGVIEDVIHGRADFGICLDAPRSHEIAHHKRHIEPLLVVTSPEHPLASLPRVTLADLSQWPLAMSSRNTGAGLLFDMACRRAHKIMHVSLETNSIELLRRFIDSGGGAAIMTYQSCVGWLREKTLSAKAIEDSWLTEVSTDVIIGSERSLTPAAELFLAEVCKQFEDVSERIVTPRRH
jgi:DNA-binding transcriptional LysR family regulator